MAVVQVHDKQFRLLIDKNVIASRILELGHAIDNDYKGLCPLLIGILNGAFIFAADLFRSISIPAEITFVKLTSYQGMQSSGNVTTAIGLTHDIHDRHIILIEDIIDTGKTLSSFIPELLKSNPASIRIASFLYKPGALQYSVHADYAGFNIGNDFVVGYGLDYAGHGRHLQGLYVLADQ